MKEYFWEENGIYYTKNDFDQNKITLVFVHGVCGSSSAFWEFEKKMQGKYNILAYDLRGHGKSKRYENYEDYKIENFSNDLFELVSYLNIKKFVIISHSFGTLVSLDFISKHQDNLSGIIFLSPNYNPKDISGAKMLRPILNFFAYLKFPISETKKRVHLDYLKDYPNTGDWNLRRTYADVSNTSLRVYLYTTLQTYSFNGENILKDITVPTLIIHGKKDTIFPVKYGMMTAERIPNSKIVLLDGVCHELKDSMITIEKISSSMDEFLKNIHN